MEGTEFILAIVAMVMGAAVIITAISKITDLIKTWINRNKSTYDDETFERLAKTFMRHKKEMTHRIEQLEAIIAEEEQLPLDQIEAPIDEEESYLKNDLNQKGRVRQ